MRESEKDRFEMKGGSEHVRERVCMGMCVRVHLETES